MTMTLEQALELGFRAGFIRACNWPAPVSQDVDSPAFAKELSRFIETHVSIFTQPAQSVAIYPVGHFIETSAGEYERVSRKHECDGDVFQLYRAIGNAQSVDVEKSFAGLRIVENADVPNGEVWVYDKSELVGKITAALQEKGNG